MRKLALSPRVVEYLIGILATGMIALGLLIYAWQEPTRIVSAQQDQLLADIDEAMTLYAENCSVCHGLAGEGIGSTPALNSPTLRELDYSSLNKIIARGLFGTAMPAWSQVDGGPLSDYQIGELVTLIQFGNWQETQDRVVNLGLVPLVPFTTEPDPLVLENLVAMEGGDTLAQGISLYAQECVACHGPDGSGSALAPALNDPTIRQRPIEELERIILNGVPGTLMAPWDSSLSGDDIAALMALLTKWDQVPYGAIPAPEEPVPVTEESLTLGSDLYANNCARCHGPEGQGTMRAPALNVKGFLEDTNDIAIQQIITLGVPETAMPAWGDRMTDAEIQALVGFIRTWEPNAPFVAESVRGGGGPWWQSGDGGEQSTGKGRGGPPWMRNQETAPQSNVPLPSGGSTQTMFDQSSQLGEEVSPPEGSGLDAQVHQPSEAGGPPWVRQQEPPIPWWQEPDWKIVGFLGGSAMTALILIGLALGNLRKLNTLP